MNMLSFHFILKLFNSVFSNPFSSQKEKKNPMNFEWKHFEILMKVFNVSEFHLAPSLWSKVLTEFDLNLGKKSFDCLEKLLVCFWIFFFFLLIVRKRTKTN